MACQNKDTFRNDTGSVEHIFHRKQRIPKYRNPRINYNKTSLHFMIMGQQNDYPRI